MANRFAQKNSAKSLFDSTLASREDRNCIKLSTSDFSYMKASKTLVKSASGVFPEKIVVTSHHTGKVIKFMMDTAAAIKNEFWDGEQMEYTSHETDVRVCLHRAY